MKLEEVQQAAVRLFAQKGYAATGIRELGREAGLNSATLYHYAGGKEELLVTIMRDCLTELLKAAKTSFESSADPRVQLARLVARHVGLSALNPLTARVTDYEIRALSEANYTALIAIRDDYESLFERVIERGQRTADFKVADARLTRLALLEMCNGVANWYRPDGRLTVADVQIRFVELASRIVGISPVSGEELGDLPTPARLPTEPFDAVAEPVGTAVPTHAQEAV